MKELCPVCGSGDREYRRDLSQREGKVEPCDDTWHLDEIESPYESGDYRTRPMVELGLTDEEWGTIELVAVITGKNVRTLIADVLRRQVEEWNQ